jgi:transposase
MLSIPRNGIGSTMNFVLQPWQLLLVVLAGWIHRQQQEIIEYLRTENQILREAHGKKRIRLNDDQRRRLAVKGKIVGRKVLGEIANIVTPDTILRWHRQLVAQKWDYSDRRKKVGRPRVSVEIVELVLRMARENPSWGYDRIEGALANLGHTISDTTVGNILRDHGIEPAPERKRQTAWQGGQDRPSNDLDRGNLEPGGTRWRCRSMFGPCGRRSGDVPVDVRSVRASKRGWRYEHGAHGERSAGRGSIRRKNNLRARGAGIHHEQRQI